MTVVEFRRRRRRSVERKGMRMHGTVEGNLGFADGNLVHDQAASSARDRCS
jgi:hypothetical protein